jgi:hypothetical protein
MYYQDYNPPHFHAEYQGLAAEFNLHTFEIIIGNLPARAKALVVEWASDHKDELLANWKKASIPEPLLTISPLN